MIELMQTLLPEPVAPAISRCGIFARSATTGSPGDALAQRDRELGLLRQVLELRRLHHAAHRDHRGAVVRHLDADDRAARHGRLDAQGRRREREREVVLERRDLVDADARAANFSTRSLRGRPSSPRSVLPCSSFSDLVLVADLPAGLDAELRDGRAFVDLRRPRVDAEAGERIDDELRASGVVVALALADERRSQAVRFPAVASSAYRGCERPLAARSRRIRSNQAPDPAEAPRGGSHLHRRHRRRVRRNR